jgi:N6-adenosine-specific RNA methylase IME4
MPRGDKAARRARLERELGRRQRAMPVRCFGVIYADPPWRFEPWSRTTGMDRAADNHYPTLSLREICALRPPAASSAVLFLWATAPMVPAALEVMAAWGFCYKSHCVWLKDRTGTGYWFRSRHELLLLGTRGKVPAPAPGTQWPSTIDAPVGRHSAKPRAFRYLIEEMFPTLPRLELFARGKPAPGWSAWGNEVDHEIVEAAE